MAQHDPRLTNYGPGEAEAAIMTHHFEPEHNPNQIDAAPETDPFADTVTEQTAKRYEGLYTDVIGQV